VCVREYHIDRERQKEHKRKVHVRLAIPIGEGCTTHVWDDKGEEMMTGEMRWMPETNGTANQRERRGIHSTHTERFGRERESHHRHRGDPRFPCPDPAFFCLTEPNIAMNHLLLTMFHATAPHSCHYHLHGPATEPPTMRRHHPPPPSPTHPDTATYCLNSCNKPTPRCNVRGYCLQRLHMTELPSPSESNPKSAVSCPAESPNLSKSIELHL